MLLLFSCSVTSDFLWPHELQHARLHCPSPSAGACPNSCPMSLWYHPTIFSIVVLFSTCLLYFPASGSFPMSQLVTSGGLPCLKLSFSWLFLLALFSLVFLDKEIKTRKTNKQTNKQKYEWDYAKLKKNIKPCKVQKTTFKMKRSCTEWKKISVNDISNKDLMSKLCK